MTEHHDSPLGRWTLARARPADLAAVVDTIWSFDGYLLRRRERHFPTGWLNLVVHLGAPYRQTHATGSEPFTTTCFSGHALTPYVVEAPPEATRVLGVRLRPLGAYALLGRPLDALTGETVDLEALVGSAATDLADACAGAATPMGRVRAAARWVRQRLQGGPAPDLAVAWMVSQLVRSRGATRVGSLHEQVSWSRARLTRAFREQVGVTPKVFARLERFRHVLTMASRPEVPLSTMALAGGYYDQSHFNAEFRAHAGVTPLAYLRLQRFPDSVSVPEGVS